ncbi:MAG TPA: hypothetical protein VN920_07110 [Pyrinomonadaceae bacterium]|nr:hypothetical protein [Pyrinomonadaceae bacterium]
MSLPLLTRAQREAENEAHRLIEHIQSALAVVAGGANDEFDSIEAAADRIERVAKDFVFALRELGEGRSSTEES